MFSIKYSLLIISKKVLSWPIFRTRSPCYGPWLLCSWEPFRPTWLPPSAVETSSRFPCCFLHICDFGICHETLTLTTRYSQWWLQDDYFHSKVAERATLHLLRQIVGIFCDEELRILVLGGIFNKCFRPDNLFKQDLPLIFDALLVIFQKGWKQFSSKSNSAVVTIAVL